MKVCALCNKLQEPDSRCPHCNEVMLDGGPIQDYFGPYSPYVSRDSLESPVCCVHLMYCPDCGGDIRECAPEKVI